MSGPVCSELADSGTDASRQTIGQTRRCALPYCVRTTECKPSFRWRGIQKNMRKREGQIAN